MIKKNHNFDFCIILGILLFVLIFLSCFSFAEDNKTETPVMVKEVKAQYFEDKFYVYGVIRDVNKSEAKSDESGIAIEIKIPQEDTDAFLKLQEVGINLIDDESKQYTGEVIDVKSNLVTVRPDRIDEFLYPGLTVKVNCYLFKKENVIVIPLQSAIMLTEKLYVVAIVCDINSDNRGRIKFSKVEIAYKNSSVAVISQGLNLGDFVVIEAKDELKEDLPVKIVPNREI